MMKSFSAKLLLFGEYGLMFGSKALAVPFPNYRGNLVRSGRLHPDQKSVESSVELERFTSWFEKEKLNDKLIYPLDLTRLKADLKDILNFQSDVPMQYGLGSSGALCAALFHEYSVYRQHPDQDKQTNFVLGNLQQDFSILESCFHGKSSGLDPLVSFLDRPVLMVDKQVSFVNLKSGQMPWSVYLIDTGLTSATSPLVRIFLNKMEDPAFSERFKSDYLPANDGAVDSFIQQRECKLFMYLQQISRFQLSHFPEMIPQQYTAIINKLLERNICIKLLGSGGGGFLLAFVPNGLQLPEMDNSFRVLMP